MGKRGAQTLHQFIMREAAVCSRMKPKWTIPEEPMPTKATEVAIANARAKAEGAIEKIVRVLEHDAMRKVGAVDVVCDYPEGCTVEIWFKDGENSVVR